ncbi:hypothetical protein CI109_105122 [Kwoniella shandongensis]|uniref:Uncharacterized protein n=1 Tax=Kwoniella shandongensis TaxID=1734106 RepID=A0A5M6C340_9TREE|nr:uncharacterized protein CI109_001961 [Kwoniella shandongensis]KAA5529536.1 hypothetical protein CI109_001961 [Kwoniella shandongensis]
MPFLRSATRPQPVQCFFCLSPSLLPPHASSLNDRKGKGRIAEVGTKWNWQCERCGCWNIKDEKGEIISDLPAMHSASYNTASFSLRAKPSSSHLPSSSSSSTSPFCHSCLANQTLIMNMLANYLPDDDDPSYPALFAELPSYLSKLHSRYPPICPNCQPAVDEALAKSDHRAQVEAWGSALKRGAANTTSGSVGEGGISDLRGVSRGDVLVWRVRGMLFWIGLGLSLAQGVTAILAPDRQDELLRRATPFSLPTALLMFHALSILWIAWDPNWLQRVRSRDKANVHGRGIWVRNMFCIMILRVAVSARIWYNESTLDWSTTAGMKAAFALEIALMLHAFARIRVARPVAIKLVRPVSHNPSPVPHLSSYNIPPHPTSPSGVSALSLGSRTPTRQANPIFGQPSLYHQQLQPGSEAEPMDWEPSPSVTLPSSHRPNNWMVPGHDDDDDDGMRPPSKLDWDTFAMNKQRMFPKQGGQDETGLESLLAGWGIGGGGGGGGVTQTVNRTTPIIRSRKQVKIDVIQHWADISFVVIRLVGTVIAYFWISPTTAYAVSVANAILLCLENLSGCFRIYTALNQGSNTQHLQPSFTKIGLIAIAIALRSAAIPPQSLVKVILSKIDDPRAGSVEWFFWACVDLVGLSS